MRPQKILFAEDDEVLAELRCKSLRSRGYEVRLAHDFVETRRERDVWKPDGIVLDLSMPPTYSAHEGLLFLEETRRLHHEMAIVILSGNGDRATQRECLARGAEDFLDKDEGIEDLEVVIRRVLFKYKQIHEHRAEMRIEKNKYGMIGECGAMQELYAEIDTCIRNDSDRDTVLILGETGTGKDLVARAIHDHGSRKGRPFVKFTCPDIADSMAPGEIFGYEKGAYTGASQGKPGYFELAGAGTVFIDEIGDLPMELQGKFLNLVQDREFRRKGGRNLIPFRARILTATNVALDHKVEAGSFRKDLYYRLRVLCIHVPPLRDRDEDILLLAEHFMHQASQERHKKLCLIGAETQEKMRQYDWPGNVRQLENLIKSAVMRAQEHETVLEIDDQLGDGGDRSCGKSEDEGTAGSLSSGRNNPPGMDSQKGGSDTRTFRQISDEHETLKIMETTRNCNWNMAEAARKLDISYSKVYRRLKTYVRLKPEEFRSFLANPPGGCRGKEAPKSLLRVLK